MRTSNSTTNHHFSLSHHREANDAQYYSILLQRLLEDKKISISEMTRRLELPSRTSINRILYGTSKYETVARFHSQLLEKCDRLRLTEAEIGALTDALEKYQYGITGYELRRAFLREILPSARSADAAPAEAHCCNTSDRCEWRGKGLREIFSRLADCAEVELFIINAVYPDCCAALLQMLQLGEREHIRLHIRHYLTANVAAHVRLEHFYLLYPLFSDRRYFCYCAADTPLSIDKVFVHSESGFENTVIIQKRTRDGRRLVERINFVTPDEFVYCPDLHDPSASIESFYADYRGELESHCAHLNPRCTSESYLNHLCTLSEELLHYERHWSQILIKPDLCISQIPPRYLQRLIADGGYFGLPPAAPEIKRLSELHAARYENFIAERHGYFFLFSAKGIRRFLETGRLSDHLAGLPPFPRCERREILAQLLTIARQKSGLFLRMFHEETEYTNFPVRIVDEEVCCVSSIFRLKDKEIVCLLRDTVLHDLLPAYTYSAQESLERIQEMIGSG